MIRLDSMQAWDRQVKKWARQLVQEEQRRSNLEMARVRCRMDAIRRWPRLQGVFL